MTIKQIASISALIACLAAGGCTPVFHAGDYAGVTPVAPVGSTAAAADQTPAILATRR